MFPTTMNWHAGLSSRTEEFPPVYPAGVDPAHLVRARGESGSGWVVTLRRLSPQPILYSRAA